MTRFGDLDQRDSLIMRDRMAAFLDRGIYPKVGDYVKFADGVERRVSYVWEGCSDDGSDSVQTSDGGSFYLGSGYCSFSGGLHPGIPGSTLKHTGSIRHGRCWFFHHDHRCAQNGIDVEPPIFDEWTSTLEAGR